LRRILTSNPPRLVLVPITLVPILRILLLSAGLGVGLGVGFAAPRNFQYPGYTRVVLDLPKAVEYEVQENPGDLVITLKGVELKNESDKLKSKELLRSSLKVKGNDTIWTLEGKSRSKPSYKVFLIKDDDGTARLVLDFGPSSKTLNPSSGTAGSLPVAHAPEGHQLRVVLDPGHGGKFPGMTGYVQEKETTLDVALRVRDLLEAQGVEVKMTRSKDTQLSSNLTTDLYMRAKLADAGTIDAFVSIHVNSGPETAQGIETFLFGKPLEKSTRSLAVLENGGGAVGEAITKKAESLANNLIGNLLAQSNLTLSKTLANKVQKQLIKDTGATNRGVKSEYLAVVRQARTPAILTEIGFGSHPDEGTKLGTSDYRQTIAQSIADGILDFLNVK
jgi:N-acetylmuramoyl-L-alanine amidase